MDVDGKFTAKMQKKHPPTPGQKSPKVAGDADEYARWLLIRRSVSDPAEVAYLACGGPPATLRELALVAGGRWAIKDLFDLGKRDCGLDEYEVRSWVGWHRHMTLSLWVVAVIRSRVPTRGGKGTRG